MCLSGYIHRSVHSLCVLPENSMLFWSHWSLIRTLFVQSLQHQPTQRCTVALHTEEYEKRWSKKICLNAKIKTNTQKKNKLKEKVGKNNWGNGKWDYSEHATALYCIYGNVLFIRKCLIYQSVETLYLIKVQNIYSIGQ